MLLKMMEELIEFEDLMIEHKTKVMDIFNYYIENSYAAYPEKRLPDDFYIRIMDMTKGYPAFVIKANGIIIGFCFVRAYNPFPAFNETVEISYFIDKGYSGKGIGKLALNKLEEESKKKGIKTILASITSLNPNSIKFHQKNGFKECGRFREVGKKFGKVFDIIWMEKKIN